jgi:hypothetical protein
MTPIRRGLLHKALRACLLAALINPCSTAISAEEPSLGRLFNTPQRRAQLDELRRRNVPIQRPAATPVTQNIRLDGIVRRSNGPTTVWINGERQQDQGNVQAAGNASAQVSTGNGRAIELKVGEQLKIAPEPNAGRRP